MGGLPVGRLTPTPIARRSLFSLSLFGKIENLSGRKSPKLDLCVTIAFISRDSRPRGYSLASAGPRSVPRRRFNASISLTGINGPAPHLHGSPLFKPSTPESSYQTFYRGSCSSASFERQQI